MCQKPGKTLIPIDKPQLYFMYVVKCVNEVCSQRRRIYRCPLLRMHVPQVNESAHLNSMGNLIPPTDQPTARVPWPDHCGGRVGGLDDGEAD